MNTWAEVEQEFACAHERQEVRYSVTSSGIRQYREQCLECGELGQFLKHTDPRIKPVDVPPVDRGLREAWHTAIRSEVARRQQIERDQASNAWWAEYNDYLQSGDWEARRRMVFDRDGYLCQGCRQAEATEVHHLTYQHLGREPLWELIAVCSKCHLSITIMDRERRGAA